MSNLPEQPDLLGIWQQDNDPIQKESISMIMRLVQEKRRSFFEHTNSELQVQLVSASLLTIVMGLYARASTLTAPRVGFGLAATGFGLMALWCWRAWRQRKATVPQYEKDGRTYCLELIALYEQKIQTVRRAHWYALPFGVMMAALTVWPYLGTFGSVILCVLVVLVWLHLRRDSVRKAEELRIRQQEIIGLLEEMDRG